MSCQSAVMLSYPIAPYKLSYPITSAKFCRSIHSPRHCKMRWRQSDSHSLITYSTHTLTPHSHLHSHSYPSRSLSPFTLTLTFHPPHTPSLSLSPWMCTTHTKPPASAVPGDNVRAPLFVHKTHTETQTFHGSLRITVLLFSISYSTALRG